VGLAQLVRFIVVELTHPGSNLIFGMSVAFMANHFLNGRWHPVGSETLFVTDFMNLKIKLAQSFGCLYIYI
jgi:hypothetical protein